MKLSYEFQSIPRGIYSAYSEKYVTEEEGLRKLRELVSVLGYKWDDDISVDSVRGIGYKNYTDFCGRVCTAKCEVTVTLA